MEANAIPLEQQLWDVTKICGYFSVSRSTVDRTIVCHPSFPRPVKIPGGPKRWIAGEIIEWASQQRG